ncbi:MAG: alanine racemase, partial [Anaerolineae bacterium]
DGRRKLAVLGDMAELGRFEDEGHREVGRKAATAVDYLVTKGERAEIVAQEALRAGMPQDRVAITYTPEEAERTVRGIVRSGDIVLVKGSMVARMELIAQRLLVDPEQAVDVLERQSPAWRQVQIIAAHRPTWVEIDLSAVAHNVRRIVEEVGPEVRVLAALKADAYGHGAVQVARTAMANGASMLGVACLPEAQELRRAGIDAPILVLGYTPAWQARDALLIDLRTTIFSTDAAEALSRAAEGLDRDAIVHVKVDTGMGRLGLKPEEVVAFLRKVSALPRLELEGLFTHFAVADTVDAWGQAGWARDYTEGQIATFTEVLDEVKEAGFEIPLAHAANSAALFAFPHSRFNMVRPGIALYGLDPSPDVKCPPDFRSVLVFKTQVAQVKEVPEGAHISYGAEFRTERPSRIAVIPVGYGDGFRRSPRNWGEVLVRGQRAPVVGRVTMDQSMLDITDIPEVRAGDEVILIGEQGEDRITAEHVAEQLGTINYEVVSAILARVPRLH